MSEMRAEGRRVSPAFRAGSSVDARRRLLVSVLTLVALVIVGTVGFRLANPEHGWFDALFATGNTLATVGDSGLRFSRAERAWALALMLVGISAALYATGNLVASIIEGDLREIFGRRKLHRRIGQLDGHYVVCGFGRMGRALCESLSAKDVPFVLVEQDPREVGRAEEAGCLCVPGDAMDEQTLVAARLESATGLATCLGSDADNVFVALTARALNGQITIIARAEDPQTQPKLRRAGADSVICLPTIGAARITQMLLNPALAELLEMAASPEQQLEISKIRMAELPGALGRSLQELELPARMGLIVIAVIRGEAERHFNPGPSWCFEARDELIVTGTSGGVQRLLQQFGPSAAGSDRVDGV